VLGGLPQLFFTCHLRPKDRRLPKASRTYGEDKIQVALVFYSTFGQLDLPGSGPVDRRDVQKYYKPTQTPTLYVGTPIAAENDMDWALKDIPIIS
jgi:hypothetical protein